MMCASAQEQDNNAFPPATSHVTHTSFQQLANHNELMIQLISDGQSQVLFPEFFF